MMEVVGMGRKKAMKGSKGYRVFFKNKYTKDEWMGQKFLHRTMSAAKRTAKVIKSQPNEHGGDLNTQIDIRTVTNSKLPVLG